MAEATDPSALVIPAQLSYLAIYNPSLGPTDETLADQIVFYSSEFTRARRKRKPDENQDVDADATKKNHEEENKKLRRIGLAQGMVDFAKNFSDGSPVDSIETDNARIVLHELEPGWWILASIDLTRLPANANSTSADTPSKPQFEYSSREVCPAALLTTYLVRAHAIFLLHHGPNLYEIYQRLSREKFCAALDRFWARFIWNWDVLLHGNPAVDIFNGIKLAAGGELGIGVGEEEWGSGERDVLEDFVRRTDGLVDIVVSRFGKKPEDSESTLKTSKKKQTEVSRVNQMWLGTGQYPDAVDGVIFSGTGALTREALRDVSGWMEWLYMYGEDAYGVRDNPHSAPRRKRRRVRPSNDTASRPGVSKPRGSFSNTHTLDSRNYGYNGFTTGIPPPLITAAETSLDKATKAAMSTQEQEGSGSQSPFDESGPEKFMKYLTLGYGSPWGTVPKKEPPNKRVSQLRSVDDSPSENSATSSLVNVEPNPEVPEEKPIVQHFNHTLGHFLIGLQGDLDNESPEDPPDLPRDQSSDEAGPKGFNDRIMVRSLHVSLSNPSPGLSISGPMAYTDLPFKPSKKLLVLVYVHQPFIFLFLFDPLTPSLSYPSFYRSLHHQLGPLQKSLLSSTCPAKVSQRLQMASTPSIPSGSQAQNPMLTNPIYDLLYDPTTLTVHTSLPNIPDLNPINYASKSQATPPWSRINALSTHSQILATITSTRTKPTELERSSKTTRGWWVVWMRIPPPVPGRTSSTSRPSTSAANPPNPNFATTETQPQFQRQRRHTSATITGAPQSQPQPPPPPIQTWKQAILVRKAIPSTSTSGNTHSKGSRWGSWGGGGGGVYSQTAKSKSWWGGGESVGSGIGTGVGLGMGIGVDARRYVEGLLSLNR
ncbi:MAG: hypothetical protein M1834_006558 [Cirrosporium novae-zelandiae]|nr:MAG: hypothetical protein M1834_006558 [Cirrosporium novae-zelandiae]